MNSVAILCRGKSLVGIDKLPNCNTLILVNSFKNELNDNTISDYVENHSDIRHVVSMGAQFKSMIKQNIYSKYDFTKIVLPYVKDCNPHIPDFLYKIQDKNNKVISVENISDECKPYMYKRGERPDGNTRYAHSFPTSGIASICHAVVDLKATDIHIIGLDFYEYVGYFTNSFGETSATDELAIHRGEDSNMMKHFFTDFVKKFDNVNFILYTMSSYYEKIDNLKIYNIE